MGWLQQVYNLAIISCSSTRYSPINKSKRLIEKMSWIWLLTNCRDRLSARNYIRQHISKLPTIVPWSCQFFCCWSKSEAQEKEKLVSRYFWVPDAWCDEINGPKRCQLGSQQRHGYQRCTSNSVMLLWTITNQIWAQNQLPSLVSLLKLILNPGP